jgi:hypothetical protein
MGPNHREAVTQHDRDAGVNPGQFVGQQQVLRRSRRLSPIRRIVPVDPEQVQRMRRVGVGTGQRGANPLGDLPGVREFGKCWENDPGLSKARHPVFVRAAVDDRSAAGSAAR